MSTSNGNATEDVIEEYAADLKAAYQQHLNGLVRVLHDLGHDHVAARPAVGAACAMADAAQSLGKLRCQVKARRHIAQLGRWMLNAHLVRHRDSCPGRGDYHTDPMLCGCFQAEEPGIRQVLHAAYTARQAADELRREVKTRRRPRGGDDA